MTTKSEPKEANRKMIKCSQCKETFSGGFDYRMHWEEFHLDYAMRQVKLT